MSIGFHVDLVTCSAVVGLVLRLSGDKSGPVFTQDLDRSWSHAVEGEKLLLAGAIEICESAIASGLERASGWTADGARYSWHGI
ncbi:MAG: hypothetical protein WAR57_11580 [Candidatus Phosphoribacter sp.]